MNIESIKYLPFLPVLAMLFCGVCVCIKPLRNFAALATVLATAAGFVLVVASLHSFVGQDPASVHPSIVPLFTWIQFENFTANFSFYIDPLTVIMLMVVTGVGTLIAIYASGYMSGDPGYARFFAYISFFIFAMLCIVMADNLVLLYLGWEGVGLASYLLIGYYFEKPSAVAAAKKAFIVNRVGDLGFALGIFTIYVIFGSVEYATIIPAAQALLHQIPVEDLSQAAHIAYDHATIAYPNLILVAPFLLMLGAFGKSAQIPLFVWLPDAMEGPTPVSALIHAATMVTSGVYMISRLLPIFELSPFSLATVAAVGAATALLGASIAMAQTDLKRVWAYSTVSQLGYMFLAVGVLSTYGGVFHLVTHAFFKALLFLTAGSVMHALAGQLDLRKISGLFGKMPVTAILMLVGVAALAGFPGLSGFYSKDTIIADAWNSSAYFSTFMGPANGPLFAHTLVVIAFVTAFLTAFYAFRLWCRVFLGPTQYELGDEHHGHEEDHASTPHADAHADHDHKPQSFPVEHHHDVHEVSFLMNAPLVVLALLAFGFGWYADQYHVIEKMILGSSAAPFIPHAAEVAEDAAHSVHSMMMGISIAIFVVAAGLAFFFHAINRPAGDAAAKAFGPLVNFLYRKCMIDELYDAIAVGPLNLASHLFFGFDSIVVEGLVSLVGGIPGFIGRHFFRPLQNGSLQGYGVAMAAGIAVILLFILVVLQLS